LNVFCKGIFFTENYIAEIVKIAQESHDECEHSRCCHQSVVNIILFIIFAAG